MEETELKEATPETTQTEATAPVEAPSAPPAESKPAPKDYKKLSLREVINDAREQAESKESQPSKAGKTVDKEPSVQKLPREKPASKPEVTEQKTEPKYKAPTSWDKTAKDVWAALPEAVHKAIEKRESEFAKGKKDYDEERKQFKELDEILKPWDGILQQNKLTRGNLVKQLLDWQHNLNNPTTKVAAFKQLAKNFGVDVAQLVDNPQQRQQTTQPPVDDGLKGAMSNFTDSVKQQLEQYKRDIETQQTVVRINAWAANKPHYERVKESMFNLMRAGMIPEDPDMNKMLDIAYDKAILLDTELYQQQQQENESKKAEEAKELAAKKERERLDALNKAKKAGSGIKPSAPTANVTSIANKKGPVSVRNSLIEAIKEVSGN